jgi:hypothetical protein
MKHTSAPRTRCPGIFIARLEIETGLAAAPHCTRQAAFQATPPWPWPHQFLHRGVTIVQPVATWILRSLRYAIRAAAVEAYRQVRHLRFSLRLVDGLIGVCAAHIRSHAHGGRDRCRMDEWIGALDSTLTVSRTQPACGSRKRQLSVVSLMCAPQMMNLLRAQNACHGTRDRCGLTGGGLARP